MRTVKRCTDGNSGKKIGTSGWKKVGLKKHNELVKEMKKTDRSFGRTRKNIVTCSCGGPIQRRKRIWKKGDKNTKMKTASLKLSGTGWRDWKDLNCRTP